MVSSRPGEQSISFDGVIGETVRPADFPEVNYLIDDPRFDAEGDWAFCLFSGGDVYGARVGFTRGSYDFSDFGETPLSAESYLLLHLQLMTKDGAILWLSTGQYAPEQMTIGGGLRHVQLISNGNEIVGIEGWPRMAWRFRSDDGRAEVSLSFDLKSVTILPDNILPGNVFSMWEAVGHVDGEVRYRDHNTAVSGTVFYDHSRFTVRRTGATTRGWHLYTPMAFDDGSVVVAYYTVDATDSCVEYYSFGLYIDGEGASRWLAKADMSDLEFDDNNLPKSMKVKWTDDEVELACDMTVRDTSILDAWGAWGAAGVPERRGDFGLIPLVLDGEARLRRETAVSTMRAYGLSEYWRMPRS